ncbi:hypothetical protein F2Q70_00042572 [Brassica cretica]|uniref:Uncharacterized protein n=1 Tax=Brassica cretica TaxID=69181 RepID=A0A8S9KJC8_BRACR|nr:hypothetical protein F2Q70_00042572 [Brassica cretica]
MGPAAKGLILRFILLRGMRIKSSEEDGVVLNPSGHNFGYMGSRGQQLLNAAPLEERFRKMSVNLMRPTEESLSKHSILGPGGLHAQWQPHKIDIKVQYPSNIDFAPVEIPSFQRQFVDSKPMITNGSNKEPERPVVESTSENIQKNYTEELSSMISFEESESVNDNHIIRQPSPPPVLAEVQDLAAGSCHEAIEAEYKMDNPLPDESLRSESPLELHIATTMMDTFLRLAKSNTKKNLETCGILAGSLVLNPSGHNFGYMGSRGQQLLNAAPLEERFRKMSVNLMRPTEESLSKHSILGPGGLRAQWQPPKIDIKVQYPSNIDFAPVEIPSFQRQFVDSKPMITNGSNNEPERPVVESTSENIQKNYTEELSSMISFEESESVNYNHIIRQPSPPPVLAEVQDLAAGSCHEAIQAECKMDNPLPDESLRSESPLELHIVSLL